ncbi:hypothetical protein ACFLZZ_00435 [Nanoarchaeota archaeon]
MVDDVLVNWLRENQAKGFDLGTLRNQLIQSGRNQQEVDEAVNSLSAPAQVQAPTAQSVAQPSEVSAETPEAKGFSMKKMIIPSVVLLLGIGLLAFFLTMGGEETTEQAVAAPEIEEVVEEPVVDTVVEETGSVEGPIEVTLQDRESVTIEIDGTEHDITARVYPDQGALEIDGSLMVGMQSGGQFVHTGPFGELYINVIEVGPHLILDEYVDAISVEFSGEPFTVEATGLGTESAEETETSETAYTFTTGETREIEINGSIYEVETTVKSESLAQFTINEESLTLYLGEEYELVDGTKVILLDITMGEPATAELDFTVPAPEVIPEGVGEVCSEDSECLSIECEEKDKVIPDAFCHYGICRCSGLSYDQMANPPCDDEIDCIVFEAIECFEEEIASCLEQSWGTGCECVSA